MSTVTMRSDMKVELVDFMGSDASFIQAARVSTLGDNTPAIMVPRIHGNTTVETWHPLVAEDDYKLINFLMANRHGSPFEHSALKFRIEAPIKVWREHMRHRVGHSYNEQSGRYTQMLPQFYVPNPDRPMVQVGKVGDYSFEPIGHDEWQAGADIIGRQAQAQWDDYLRLKGLGWANEVARGVLGVNIYSRAYVTVNARSMMAFLSLRRQKNLDGEATYPSKPMWEIDEVAEQMEVIFANLFPHTWQAYVDNGRVGP